MKRTNELRTTPHPAHLIWALLVWMTPACGAASFLEGDGTLCDPYSGLCGGGVPDLDYPPCGGTCAYVDVMNASSLPWTSVQRFSGCSGELLETPLLPGERRRLADLVTGFCSGRLCDVVGRQTFYLRQRDSEPNYFFRSAVPVECGQTGVLVFQDANPPVEGRPYTWTFYVEN